jgi:hypothetical protein
MWTGRCAPLEMHQLAPTSKNGKGRWMLGFVWKLGKEDRSRGGSEIDVEKATASKICKGCCSSAVGNCSKTMRTQVGWAASIFAFSKASFEGDFYFSFGSGACVLSRRDEGV